MIHLHSMGTAKFPHGGVLLRPRPPKLVASMADPDLYTDTRDDTALELDSEPTGGRPRWMSVLAVVVVIVLVLLLVVLHLTGTIGPGIHS